MSRHHRLHDYDDLPGAGAAPPSVDPAQESLSQALRAGFNVLRLIIVLLLLAYFLSGLFQVNPGEQGLVARFGRLLINDDEGSKYAGSPVFAEGWHWFWPDPVDEKIPISGRTYKPMIYTFCFPIEQDVEFGNVNMSELAPFVANFTPGVHGALLSGDRNLSHGLFAIEYRIDNAATFVQNVGDSPESFDNLLRRLAENAILRTVAGMPVERVIRTQTDEVAGDFTLAIKRRLSDELAQLSTGVTIINVEAKTVEPGKVRQAFLAVSNAKNERKQKESQAQQEANRILSKTAGSEDTYERLLEAIDTYGAAQATGAEEARLEELRLGIDQQLEQAEGDVAKRLRQAQSGANEIRLRVQQEYELFVKYREMYRKYPQLTAVRLWVRMRDAILGSQDNEIFFVPAAGEIEIITNRDLQRQIEADLKRYQDRYNTGTPSTTPRPRGR